jgi:hypothetical protein
MVLCYSRQPLTERLFVNYVDDDFLVSEPVYGG